MENKYNESRASTIQWAQALWANRLAYSTKKNMASNVGKTKNISRLPSYSIVQLEVLMEERCVLLVVVAYGVDLVLVFPFYNLLIIIFLIVLLMMWG